MDGLAALVQQALRADPFAGDVFIFRPKRADRVKILVYDGTGLCLYSEEAGGRAVLLALAGGRRGALERGAARDPARGLAVAPAPAPRDPSPEHGLVSGSAGFLGLRPIEWRHVAGAEMIFHAIPIGCCSICSR